MTKNRTIYIHAGLPKTGTTSIQVFLASHRKELLEQGFLYPEISLPADVSGLLGTEIFMPEVHHSLAVSNSGRDAVELALQKLGRDPWDIVREQFDTSGANNMILSSEMFAMEAKSSNLGENLKRFGDCTIVIILLVRRTDRWAESLYLQRVLGNQRWSKSFSRTGSLNNRRARSFLHLAIGLQKSVPDGNLVIRSFEDLAGDGELINSFLRIVDDGLASKISTLAKAYRSVNESLAKQEVLFVKRLNALAVDDEIFGEVRSILWGNSGQWRSHWSGDALSVIPLVERASMIGEYNSDVELSNLLFDSDLSGVDIADAAVTELPFQENIRQDQSSTILGLLKDHMAQESWTQLNEKMGGFSTDRELDQGGSAVGGVTRDPGQPGVRLEDEMALRRKLLENNFQSRPNYDLMKLLMEQGRNEDALLFGLRSLQRSTVNPNIFVDVLTLLAGLKLTTLVHALSVEAIKDGIEDPRIYAALARSQAVMQDWASAKRTLEQGDSRHPDNKILQTTKANVRALRLADL